MADISRGDWQCPNPQCYNHANFPNSYVYGSSVNCKKCGTGRVATRPGDWCCPNPQCVNSRNCVYGSKSVCPKCGCLKPAALGKGGGAEGAGQGQPWCRPVLGKGAAGDLGALWGAGLDVALGLARKGDWHCPNSACKNHTGNVVYASKTMCPLCGMAKPALPPMALPLGNQFQNGRRAGDWNCPNAGCKNHVENVVYASKTHCPLCSTPKPQEGATRCAAVAETRPGDWHCPNSVCKNHRANVVYASKTVCPLCQTPRPALNGGDERLRSRSPRAEPR